MAALTLFAVKKWKSCCSSQLEPFYTGHEQNSHRRWWMQVISIWCHASAQEFNNNTNFQIHICWTLKINSIITTAIRYRWHIMYLNLNDVHILLIPKLFPLSPPLPSKPGGAIDILLSLFRASVSSLPLPRWLDPPRPFRRRFVIPIWQEGEKKDRRRTDDDRYTKVQSASLRWEVRFRVPFSWNHPWKYIPGFQFSSVT